MNTKLKLLKEQRQKLRRVFKTFCSEKLFKLKKNYNYESFTLNNETFNLKYYNQMRIKKSYDK